MPSQDGNWNLFVISASWNLRNLCLRCVTCDSEDLSSTGIDSSGGNKNSNQSSGCLLFQIASSGSRWERIVRIVPLTLGAADARIPINSSLGRVTLVTTAAPPSVRATQSTGQWASEAIELEPGNLKPTSTATQKLNEYHLKVREEGRFLPSLFVGRRHLTYTYLPARPTGALSWCRTTLANDDEALLSAAHRWSARAPKVLKWLHNVEEHVEKRTYNYKSLSFFDEPICEFTRRNQVDWLRLLQILHSNSL